MLHYTPHAVVGSLLFNDWYEARALWYRLARSACGLVALCLMPDHCHVLTSVDSRRSLQHAMSGYARWRNARRGERGSAWKPLAEPTCPSTPQKQRRDVRYIHLNPCRRHLVSDPLDWPFSTHRDAVGLAVPLVRRLHPNPHAFHRYVSGDPTVNVQGTSLPLRAEADLQGPEALLAVWSAVSAVTRTPTRLLHAEGGPRRLFVRAARTLTPASSRAIADMAQVTPRSVNMAPVGMDREVAVVERVCGDLRFRALGEVDTSRWHLPRRFRRP